MNLRQLTAKSLLNRKLTASLCIISISVSVALLIAIHIVRESARESFFGTVAGVDLIVGARTGGINLLLYSVFHLGAATNNVSWKSYQDIAASPEIDWIVPISLGDSHRGFRVVGTTTQFFDKLRYRGGRRLEFGLGEAPKDLFDVVLGADVAESLGYVIGERIVLTHGIAAGGFGEHRDKPFQVVGVLKRTGTPVDRSIQVLLEGITALHVDWQQGVPPEKGEGLDATAVRKLDLTPTSITAAFVGLRSKLSVFKLQRTINDYSSEAVMAVLPGVAMSELWQVVGGVERAMTAIAVLVVVAGLVGLCSTLLSTLNERRREIAILRALGASPVKVSGLLIGEAAILSALGIFLGIVLAYGGLILARPVLELRYGLSLSLGYPKPELLLLVGVLFVFGVLSGVVPAIVAYRRALSDGLSVRI